jgi:hypothetical protein
MTDMSPSPPLWEKYYQEAVNEPDLQKLRERVHTAEEAICERWRELAIADYSEPELRLIHEATEVLLKLKTEKLNWPAMGVTTPPDPPHSPPRGPLNYSRANG